jgi:hypothetical protein
LPLNEALELYFEHGGIFLNIEKGRVFPKVGSLIILLYIVESLVVLSTNYIPYLGEDGSEDLITESGIILLITVGLLTYLVRSLLAGSKAILQINYILLAVNVLPVLFLKGGGISTFENVDYLSLLGGGVVLLIIALCRTSEMQKWLVHKKL